MKIGNRIKALEALEKVALKERDLSYRRICDYVLGYQLSREDSIWLYERLKEKGVSILGMDPTAEPEEETQKLWYVERGSHNNTVETSLHGVLWACVILKQLFSCPL